MGVILDNNLKFISKTVFFHHRNSCSIVPEAARRSVLDYFTALPTGLVQGTTNLLPQARNSSEERHDVLDCKKEI